MRGKGHEEKWEQEKRIYDGMRGKEKKLEGGREEKD